MEQFLGKLKWGVAFLIIIIDNASLSNHLFRLFSDFLGFAGALGIQVIVSSIENDTGDFDKFSCKSRNITISGNNTVKEDYSEAFAVADTLTVFQFIHNQSVAAIIILLASLSQGGFSQVTFCLITNMIPWWTYYYSSRVMF